MVLGIGLRRRKTAGPKTKRSKQKVIYYSRGIKYFETTRKYKFRMKIKKLSLNHTSSHASDASQQPLAGRTWKKNGDLGEVMCF